MSRSGKGEQSSSDRSQRATAADLSIQEKLDVIPALLIGLGNAITALFTGVYRRKETRPDSYYRYVILTLVRTLSWRLSPRQHHYLSPTTDDAYLATCKKRAIEPKSEILEDGTKAHWIGDSRAEKLIVNFHGGGYVLPAHRAMVEFMFQVIDFLKSHGKQDVACLFLSYDLAPGAIYPRQLQQASLLMNHIITNLHITPNNIIVTGDSAGANLALSLFSHISHPHPSNSLSIPKVVLSEPLRGLVLTSPWVSFDITSESFKHNQYKDCVGHTGGTKWSSAYLGCPWPHKGKTDNYNEAAIAPASWWKDLAVQKGGVLIVCGEEEVLRDGIVEFESRLVEGWGKVEFLCAKGEYHDQPNIDLQLGLNESDEGEQAKLIKRWIASKL